MAEWAGEEKDWIKLMTQLKPRKVDVTRSLLGSMNQAVEKKKESKRPVPTKQPRDLPPLELGVPVAGKLPTLEIKGDCKTVVDWLTATPR